MAGRRFRAGVDLIERALEKVLGSMSLPSPSSDEKAHLDELRDSLRRLPVEKEKASQRSSSTWSGFSRRLTELVLSGDPRRFLQWDVVVQTMFVDTAEYITTELRYLKRRPDWAARWRTAIKETWVGNPRRYLLHPSSSRNLIHHAYHVACFEERTRLNAAETHFVLEFGGGYGSMCRLFHQLGFRGTYVIFDLPVFTALQMYYLRTMGLPLVTVEDAREHKSGVLCISDMRVLEELLEKVNREMRSLFIATWSLSETPGEFRRTFLPLVAGFNSFLLAYQEEFGEMHNLGAFDELRDRFPEIAWQGWPIEHIPGNHYLVGKRSTATGSPASWQAAAGS